MAKEIERKFLVVNDSYKALSTGCRHIVQGYLSSDPKSTVRVRIREDQAFLTVKGITIGAERDEWEYEIPAADARAMLECCRGRVLNKTRWIVPATVVGSPDAFWEVDEFHGKLEGLVIAEIELPCADASFDLPGFIGAEVTGQAQYYNSSLVAASAD